MSMSFAGTAAVVVAFAADPTPAGTGTMSVWDFAVKGGPTIIVIALCSLVALAVIVERLLLTRRSAVAPATLVPMLKAAAGDPARAIDLCRADPSPLSRILIPALRHRGESTDSIKRSVSEAGRREIARLKHRMRLLGALPQVCTMLGLLGTILGMIKTFQAIATSGQSLGKTELLARGIFEAWANTAAGLLLGRIDARATELDRIASEWIEEKADHLPAVPQAPSPVTHVNGAVPTLAGVS
jgi:biopolymer transport protein ExbB